MAPKRSTSEKVKAFFTNPFRRASATSKGRPTTSQGRPTTTRPDPFLSQDTRPQDVQALHEFWNRNQPADAPSTSANPSSSQGTRQPRSNLPFGERMRADFRAGVDETSAALMGQPPVPHRRRERESSRAPLAPPTAAHLGAARTPVHREREPTRRVPISAPVAPANLADSASDANARTRAQERARERERAFHQVPEPIQNVPAHRIQLNPPTTRESVYVQLSGASSSSSRETRWDDFAGPAPTAPLPPLPAAPAPAPLPVRRNAISRRPVPPPRCQLCQAQPAILNSNLCGYCKSVTFYPEDYPRASVYPVMSPAFSPPPVAHLKDSSYTKARQSQTQRQPQPQPPSRSQSQAQRQPQPPPRSQPQPQPQPKPQPPPRSQHRTPLRTQSQLQSPTHHPPHTQPPPRRTQSRTTSHVVSPLTPHEARFRDRDRRSVLSAVSPIVPDEDVHPALRRSSQRYAAVPDRRGALAAQTQTQGAGAGAGSARRGAVSGSGRGEMPVETPVVPWEGEDLWWP